MKQKYEILEHPADLKIRAYGQNLSELFNNVLLAMTEAMKPRVIEQNFISQKIDLKANNLENLLIDFLSEVIYQTDLNNLVYSRAEFDKINKQELSGKIFGQKIKTLETEIKAVTWHDLEVKKENNQWRAILIFDL